MQDIKALLGELRQARDELRLKIHLGSKDLQDQWTGLEGRWKEFEGKAELQRSTQDVSTAVKSLGSELKHAYERLSKAIRS